MSFIPGSAPLINQSPPKWADGTCDYAGDRHFARHDHAVQPEASSPAS